MNPEENQPAINHGRWNQEEEKQFVQALKSYGCDWKKIAECVETRSPLQLRSHAQKYFQKLKRIEKKEGLKKQRFPVMKKQRRKEADSYQEIFKYQQAYLYHSFKANQFMHLINQHIQLQNRENIAVPIPQNLTINVNGFNS